MYNTIKNVLAQGDYNLTNMLDKIDLIWVKNKLTNEEYEELVTLAREGAQTKHSIDALEKLAELDKRVSALEKENGGEDAPSVEYHEYEVGKWYYTGDKVSFEGANYTCIAPDGVVCVWSPSAYPAYWEKA